MKIKKDLKELLEIIEPDKKFERALNLGSDKAVLNNVKGSLKSILAYATMHKKGKPILIVAENSNECLKYLNDLELLGDKNEIATLFSMPKHIKNKLAEEKNDNSWILDGLNKINTLDKFLAIVDKNSLDLDIPDPNQIFSNSITIKKNEKVNFTEFTNGLISNGFERQDYVATSGDIAIRGGIVDIFPIGFDNPLRIEFWGDDIESIREFDPLSQRSNKEFDKIDILTKFSRETESNSTKILNVLPENIIYFVDSPQLVFDEEDLLKDVKYRIDVNSLNRASVKFESSDQRNFNSSILPAAEFLKDNVNIAKKIFITAESDQHIKRVQGILCSNFENSLGFTEPEIDELFGKISWHSSSLSEGFELKPDYYFFTEHQIFDRNRIPDRKSQKSKIQKSIQELNSLKLGDLVVHEDKGIGRFEGFRTINIGGSQQDCVQLAFDGGDTLYVNMQYVNKIQKYSASEGVVPTLSKLGSADWTRKKAKTKKKLKDIARDLIKIYAKRKMQPGFAFSQDTTWQKEFEASFLYDDTIDQVTATSEIKSDMESERPMDRLLCGDVGFGKTEVAARAAFKTVQEGKQVAILVPTTVLAQQHYNTFKDRLSRYPVNVEVISRFRKKSEQTEILTNLKSGRVDILIGTHRLLSKDIQFKDLGLLVIDEEQRFGVSAKEKLREMRVSVDTLTLTATPIPRTLNFSLMGARDLSVIETPPRNRLPVETEILEYDEEFVQEVVEKEVNRGGQVFFVSDKVQDLDKIAMDLKILMPAYDFAVAHGQMKPAELEKIMQNFISGKTDVLITTKIVESGLDIPNANTMIINRANNFGLAELYQLRGRVGRTNTQAYCYLLLPKASKISKVAIRRLQAIEEFTDLGSGFQLAMKDMEIRGAGNLLGAEQSGLIIDIGMELYQKVLDEAIQELKKDEFSEIFDDDDWDDTIFHNEDVGIDIGEDAFIPDSFIQQDTERFSTYKKLYSLKKQKDLTDLTKELKDKFGKFSREMDNLLFGVKLRINAIPTGFNKVTIKNNLIKCEFPDSSKEDYFKYAFPAIIEFVQSMPESKLTQGKKNLIWEKPIASKDEAVEIIWKINKTLQNIEI